MNKGFTLLEVLVTLSIVVIVASLIFANYPKFKEGISLKKTSQEIALTIREAQNYALSVKEFEGKYESYGVHFEISSPKSYFIFSDLNGDNKYDSPGEKVKEFIIQTNDKILDLCGYDTGYVCDQNYLDIIFMRPTPVVTLKSDIKDYSGVKIVITSPRNKEKSVIVWMSGQVSIE